MKKLLVVMMFLLAGVVFAQQTQNLGDLAKKEKARREELEKTGKKAKVYTKEDVDRVKEKLGSDSTTSSDSSGEETSGEDTTLSDESANAANDDSVSSSEDYVVDPQLLKQEEIKEQRRKDVESQIEDLKQQKEALQQRIDETTGQTAGGSMAVNPALTVQGIDSLKNSMNELDQKIGDLEERLSSMDEGRE